MQTSSLNPCVVGFIPGVGRKDYICGASKSMHLIAKYMQPHPLTILDGDCGIYPELIRDHLPIEIVQAPTEHLSGLNSSSLYRKLTFGWKWLVYTLKLCRTLRRWKVNVVYTTNSASLLAVPAIRLAGARLVIGFRGDFTPSKKWRLSLSQADHVLCLSKETKAAILECLPRNKWRTFERKISILPNGIDLSEFKALFARGHLGHSSDRYVSAIPPAVLYVAAFRPLKHQLEFLRFSAPEILSKFPHAKLVFYGGAPDSDAQQYLDACKLEAEKLGITNSVTFEGYSSDLTKVYSNATLLALASEREGMPRCVIEGMTAGLPIVCFQVSSVDELVSKPEAGFVVQQGDFAGLAEKINEILANPYLARKLGDNGHRYVRDHLAIQEVAKTYQSLLSSLIRE